MKISRSPFEEHISREGCFVSNFNVWRIMLDGVRQDNTDILAADSEAGVIEMFKRDSMGRLLFDDNSGLPQTEIVRGEVTLEGRIPSCTGCSMKAQERRKTQNWWVL